MPVNSRHDAAADLVGAAMQTILVMSAVIWGLPPAVAAISAAPMVFSRRYRQFEVVPVFRTGG